MFFKVFLESSKLFVNCDNVLVDEVIWGIAKRNFHKLQHWWWHVFKGVRLRIHNLTFNIGGTQLRIQQQTPTSLKNLRTPDSLGTKSASFPLHEFYGKPVLLWRSTEKNNNTRRRPYLINITGPCLATNPIDQCCRFFWFGYQTGKGCKINIMIDPSDNDTVNPKHG